MEKLPILPTKISGTLCVKPTELYEGFFVAKIKRLQYYQNQKTLRKKSKKEKILQKMPKCNINIKKK